MEGSGPRRTLPGKRGFGILAGMKHEIVFDVTQEADGGYTAEALGEDVFTQADTWEGLRANVREAVEAYWFDQPERSSVRLRLTRDEVLV
jgi:predicted RNase H-like HicB family nuclease